MNLRSFLNLYVSAALFGAGAFWWVAGSSMILNKRTSFSPVPHVKQSHLTSEPVKPGAYFERESPTPYRIARSARPVRDGGGVAPSYTPQVALSRGVHHEPGSAHLPGGRAGAYLYEVTAYSHGCIMPVVGAEGHARRAANGRWPVADVTVAADTSLHPFGTEVLIEGLGFRTVGDRGHAIKGRRLDLFVDSCREARKFGRRWLAVNLVPPQSTRFASERGAQ